MTAPEEPRSNGIGPDAVASMRRAPWRPLLKTLDQERAVELVTELGFLGIVDLVTLLSHCISGSIDAVGDRVVVKIKKPPRVKKKPTEKR